MDKQMPQIGDICKGSELKRCGYYIYVRCDYCGLTRWTRLKSLRKKTTVSKHCSPCVARLNLLGIAPREHSPNWKGGRYIASSGYAILWEPHHPRAAKRSKRGGRGYVLEHIVIWEQAHGRQLPKGWVIHHLNGIKADNRPSNLVALPDKKHRRIFEAKAKRIQELEALLNNQQQLL